MFVQRRTKGGIFAAVVAAAALVVSAIPAHAETGVTSSTIKLGVTLPLTGAAAPGYNKIHTWTKPARSYAEFSPSQARTRPRCPTLNQQYNFPPKP